MDIHSDIVKWLRELGHNEQIPENFICICNKSTKLLWEQLMENVRPKQEVERIRRNVILNRLRLKPLNKQDDFAYKIKEIEEYKQKLSIEKKLKVMNEMVQEKQYKVEQMSQKCKMKDACVDILKNKIKENEQRQFLLDSKRKQLELQNVQAEETLTKLKNVTPVEREESTTSKEITETLERCAEKLNKILLDNQKSITEKHPVAPCTVIKNKSNYDQPSISKYLSMREREDFEEIARSCRKKDRDKENVDSNIQEEGRMKIKQRMFTTPQIIIEEMERSSFEQLGVKLLPPDETSSDTDSTPSISRPTKRESLGLLPDSCLQQVSSNDSFLNVIGNESNKITEVLEQSSFKHDRKIAKTDDKVKTELCHNKGVNRALELLLHGNNRQLIYETLLKCIQNIKVELTKNLAKEKGVDERQNKINEVDIAKLSFIHIQTELKIVEQKRALKDLAAKIGRRKLQILSASKSEENRGALLDRLDLSIKQLAIDASLAAMKKEVSCSNIAENNDNDLKVLSSKIMKIKVEIANKIQLIQLTIDDIGAAQKHIAATRESVLIPIWHIRMLRTDTDWMNPLLEDTWTEEIRVFENFPLEYQRRCIYTEPKSFYRDLCVDNYPQGTEISPDDLQLISDILESPFNPPETILLNVIKAQMKMNALKSVIASSSNDSYAEQSIGKYSLEDLQRKESYLEFALDRLKSLMYSSGKALAVGDVVKQAIGIWTELPMKEIISDKRLLDGQNYQFYQARLEGFL